MTTPTELIARFESCRLSAYQDSAGIWTIGYGHTYGVRASATCSQEQADRWLDNEVLLTENAVRGALGSVPTTDNQLAAMVSLAYNIGIGAFRGSSVRRLHVAGHFTSAANAFLPWDRIHVDGQLVTLPGLLNRRVAERNLYLAA
jgi:GH24 family phage-related lysozyme (muramidase)